MSAYDELMTFQRQTEALAQVAGRLGWDQETMMPPGAAEQRGEELGAMEEMLHARRTAPEVGQWLAAVEDSTLDAVGRAQMRHIRRNYERAVRVPAALAARIARTTSVAYGKWARARADEDFAAFAPVLSEIVALRREEAAHIAGAGDAYDALLQGYEPGATGAEVASLFDDLRPGLVALRAAVLDRPAPDPVSGSFDPAAQMVLSRRLAEVFGYDFDRGRIDKAVHPFSSGSGADVRITTRTAADDPFNCAYSTIHEVGHACYEQGIDAGYALSPLGQGVSLGVHESQSRIYENQLGRSRAFCHWLYGQMRDAFGDLGVTGEEAFYTAVNRVQRGFIRTEADEVQYNLHIMLRFDLERDMARGKLDVADLEEAWNARFAEDFGYSVDKPSNGVLQDVHWAAGLLGYFPTYALGNVYAGCLYLALQDDVADLDGQLARGDLSGATGWLHANVQRFGGLYEPRAVIEQACGFAPSEAPLLGYLEQKFADLYDL
ncbi:carboxypeptidase M32 [Marinovum algicola]|uniref:carboxypeptidase M32 n=1 Tax=Marinovum algicola TaxID=42444 RepID=UPI0024BA8144|nr:carboxypeptidase M32 [Marinovum algicola]